MRFPVTRTVASSGGSIVVLVLDVVVTVVLGAVVEVVVGQAPARGVQTVSYTHLTLPTILRV